MAFSLSHLLLITAEVFVLLSDVLQGRQRAGGAHPRSCLARNHTAGPHPSSVNVQALGEGLPGVIMETQLFPQADSNRKRISARKPGRVSGVGGSRCRRERPGSDVEVVRRWRALRINTKGFALVIPLLPPRARERGAVKLPHSPVVRLVFMAWGQGCAAPVLPFAGTVELFRRAGSAAPDPEPSAEWVRVMRPSTLPEPCRSRYRIALIVQMSSK